MCRVLSTQAGLYLCQSAVIVYEIIGVGNKWAKVSISISVPQAESSSIWLAAEYYDIWQDGEALSLGPTGSGENSLPCSALTLTRQWKATKTIQG